MSYFEASTILLFGIILPTVDCWSDIWLSMIILLGEALSECFGHLFETERQIIGGVTLAFPILSFLFMSFHWWRLENINREGGSGRLNTLVLLILQVWPQYRMIRLLYLGLWKKNSQWRREQKVILENVSGVEPFIESVPQVYWIVCVWMITGCIGPGELPEDQGWSQGSEPTFKTDYTGLITFVSSILSASYGLTNFFRVGPLKVIPNQPASGFGHLSFFLIFVSVASSLVAKGIVVMYGMYPVLFLKNSGRNDFFVNKLVDHGLVTMLFIPQLLLAIGTLMRVVGFKSTLKLMLSHSSVVLTPLFTPFVFGPVNSNCCSNNKQTDKKIRVNYGLTFVNLAISTTCMIGLHFYILNGYRSDPVVMNPFWIFPEEQYWLENNRIILMYGLPVYAVGILATIILVLTDVLSLCCKPARVTKTAIEILDGLDPTNDVEMSVIENSQLGCV